ncbi:MAG TPA: NAD-dependent epimerase/dehydratase family protein [Tepidisphaeraceae bacterium]|jgi:nucleoside-diphosphate-sugar epimerase
MSNTDWQILHGDHFQGQKILITGGAGFIGSHIAEALTALGAHVIVIDDLSGGSTDNLAHLPKVDFHQGSILDTNLLATITKGVRYIYHEAALGSVPRSVEQPVLYNDVNTKGTLNVLEAAKAAGVARVIFAASSSAYGDNPNPWKETMPVLPKSPYAATKVAGEALLRAYACSLKLDTCSLRYFNIFGPRQNANSAYAAVIAAFAKSLLAGEHPTIFGDGLQSRDFTFVRNAVHANLLAARHEKPLDGAVINVGCGHQISVNALAALMARAWHRPELTPIHKPERAGDIKHSYADLARARATLHYSPIVDFEPGLTETMAWYKTVLAPASTEPAKV